MTVNPSAARSVVRVRQAVTDDADRIAKIWYQGWRDGHLGGVPDELIAARTEESFAPRALANLPHTAVAEVDNTVAGFVTVASDELEQLYLDAAHRGSGVASALLAEGERRIAAAGHDRAWLAVVAANTRARRYVRDM